MQKELFVLGCLLLTSSPVFRVAHAAELVSKNAAGTDSANGVSLDPAISANGLVVVFRSGANNFGPADTNGKVDVYVRNLLTGEIKLASINAASTNGGNRNCDLPPAISADGGRVAFATLAHDLGPTDTNNALDVYVRDLQAGTTTLVSVNAQGNNGGNSGSFEPKFSADGRFVLFVSGASNLGPTDTNGHLDVYVRDLVANTTTLVSANTEGNNGGNLDSGEAKISANGRFAVFVSSASDLVGLPTSGYGDVYVRDLVTGTTMLASVNADDTAGGNARSDTPFISADGRFVAFTSAADNLDTLGPGYGVYVRDLVAGTTSRVSVSVSGTASDGIASALGISADGRFVLFQSTALDLVPLNIANPNVYVRDLVAGVTKLVSVNAEGIDDAGGGEPASISADGRFITFASASEELGPPDTNGLLDIYRKDMATGQVTLISANGSGTSGGNWESSVSAMSADGQVVAFRSRGNDFGPTDTNGFNDIYVGGPGSGSSCP
jgi:Tol biopolymer transport system component